MGTELRDQFSEQLKTAIKAQDKRRMSTLRLITAALKDRDIALRTAGKGERVPESDIHDMLAKMIKQRNESVKNYEEAGRVELAQQERDEIDVIAEFLPRQMDDTEIEAACAEVIAEVEADSLKDMGKTMGALKQRFAGQMDFSKASAVVKAKLGEAAG
jgi:uncharacterized protein YqeY